MLTTIEMTQNYEDIVRTWYNRLRPTFLLSDTSDAVRLDRPVDAFGIRNSVDELPRRPPIDTGPLTRIYRKYLQLSCLRPQDSPGYQNMPALPRKNCRVAFTFLPGEVLKDKQIHPLHDYISNFIAAYRR